ncbi:MAG: thioredoxin fold domain-containing protein [Aquificaceae bacterium]|nr:thioredoxin fold domain-containing protein [Aquificaceae bacterium]MDW8237212.1 thioredoxin fold domain-containing protein [Aquificaceae bacterium]
MRSALFALFTMAAFASEGIPYLKPSFLNLKEEVQEAKKEGKTLIIMFHRDGCPACERLRETMKEKQVVDYFKPRFNLIQVDILSSSELTAPDGKKTTEKGFSQSMGVRATPMLIFYDQNGTVALTLAGPLDSKTLLSAGKFVAEGYYKTKSFTQFLKDSK